MSSPTQRTLAELRKRGHIAAVCEFWRAIPGHPAGGVRKDLFGFLDLVALVDGRIVGIQCTSGANTSARERKIRAECWDNASAWLSCGGRIEVWGWRKLKKKVGNRTWFPRITEVVSR